MKPQAGPKALKPPNKNPIPLPSLALTETPLTPQTPKAFKIEAQKAAPSEPKVLAMATLKRALIVGLGKLNPKVKVRVSDFGSQWGEL